ncbi:MAG: flagellar export protein FliJ [Lachnospiraceae bacterium]|nr:flagellar export protein FliJ [Lachnospiraceae bacterium]
MARFVYRMQNILDIKYKLEAQARSDYAVAAAKLAEEEEKLAALYLRKRQYEQKKKELLEDRLNVMDLNLNKKAIDTMKSLIRDQSLQVHIAQRNLEEERKKLSEIMKDRKTHEKLKEHKFEEFKEELKAEESKEIDQLVSFKHNDTTEEE